MSIYVITIAILLLFSHIEISGADSATRYVMLLIAFFIFVAQIGLRWEMGTDWTPYRDHFEQEHTWESVLLNVIIGFELGYGLFVWFIHSISDNYTVFLLAHAIIFYILIFKATNHLSKYPILTLLLFYAVMMGLTGSNRQLLALAICLYSLKYAINKKFVPFLLCISIATLFHTSALLFSFYYLFNRDLKKRTIFSLLTLSIVIGFSSIPSFVFNSIAGFFGETLSQKAEYYIDGSNLAYIWGGDVNQNGNLESEDATAIYVAAVSDDETVNNGYVINDIDGNGNIDSQDYGIAYSNSIVGANVINPFSYQKKK